jgi:uncharacterized protein YhaN
MKYLILPLAALATLSACSEQQQQSVENRFQQTENAIENAADALEAETNNATRAATGALEKEADEFENRIDAIDIVPGSGNRTAARTGNAQ